ncbi:hypothetical protein QCA50_007137 [Cerrena zonata]|uniref:Uncharacterized protein n=1 Tax=Cerrena zonata TaxID=2478898 RepID=A0AAW0G7N9_9APHY
MHAIPHYPLYCSTDRYLYPPPSFDHADLQLVHHVTSVCRDEALFQLMAAEHRMMFFMERLKASCRELERNYLNYCRAVEVIESGLDLQGGDSGEDVEMGGEGELEMAFVQPAAEREVDLNEEEPEYADVQV